MGSSNDVGDALSRWLNRGLEAMDTARVERQRRNDPVEMARARRNAALVERSRVERAEIERRQRYRDWLRRLRVRATSGTYVAIGAAGLGVIDVATLGAADNGVIPAGPGLWFVASAVSGLIAVRAKAQLRNAEPPAPLPLPAVPAPVLPPGVVGSEEALALVRAEHQLAAMIPAVWQLHEEAGRDLQETVASVQPRMVRLIERLELVSTVDPLAAPQAAEAAETLRRRLAAGVRAYEHLIAATSTLLAAPDPTGRASERLEAATQNLEAYAAGLSAASDVFDSPQEY